MTMSNASVSSTLQCWVTVLLPRHIVTSTPPQGMDGTPIPYSYGNGLSFLEGL